MADNHGHLTTDQICRQFWKPIDVTVRPAILDGDILPLDETRLFQASPECDDEVRRVGGRCDPQEADHRHGCLLGACDARPSRRRAAEKRDEIAPSHCSPKIRNKAPYQVDLAMSALGQKQTFALHQPMSALPPITTAKADMPQMVMSALHPIADMCSALAHVC